MDLGIFYLIICRLGGEHLVRCPIRLVGFEETHCTVEHNKPALADGHRENLFWLAASGRLTFCLWHSASVCLRIPVVLESLTSFQNHAQEGLLIWGEEPSISTSIFFKISSTFKQKICKGSTKNSWIPLTQIHQLLTFYHICSVIAAFSLLTYWLMFIYYTDVYFCLWNHL